MLDGGHLKPADSPRLLTWLALCVAVWAILRLVGS